MSITNYLILFMAAMLGQAFHIFGIKIPATKKRHEVANVPFTIGDYFKEDMVAILASVITILIALVTLDELVRFRPSLAPWLRALFVFVGFTGSSILIALLGKASSKLNDIIDVKTDKADGKPAKHK